MLVLFKSRAEAADYLTARGLPITKSTLQKLACTGGGPLYRIWGNRAVYAIEDLDGYAEAKLTLPRKSTSDIGAA
jgi:hypothetical protein